jgi:hypothetical protein
MMDIVMVSMSKTRKSRSRSRIMCSQVMIKTLTARTHYTPQRCTQATYEQRQSTGSARRLAATLTSLDRTEWALLVSNDVPRTILCDVSVTLFK